MRGIEKSQVSEEMQTWSSVVILWQVRAWWREGDRKRRPSEVWI